jgi:hypothetical protein
MKKRYRNMQKKANGKVREISNGGAIAYVGGDECRVRDDSRG